MLGHQCEDGIVQGIKMSDEKESLEIVDTRNVLTVEELQELKKLASMSKTARAVIAIVIGGVMLIGGDKLIELVQAHGTVTH